MRRRSVVCWRGPAAREWPKVRPRGMPLLLVAVLFAQGPVRAETPSDEPATVRAGAVVPGPVEDGGRFYDPVEFRAEILDGLLGKKIDRLRMYAMEGGALHQIPFQVDEWTEDGYMVLDRGELANGDRANGVLDGRDMVVLMAREVGEPAPRGSWPPGVDVGLEIRLEDPASGELGRCYLLHFPETPPPFPFTGVSQMESTDVLKASGVTYTIVGTNKKRGKKVYRTIVNRHIWVTPAAGGDGRDFIDRSKFRASAALLFGLIKIRYDEDSFLGGVDKFKIGPVRTVGRQWFSITLPMGLKSPRIYGDVYCYDTMVLIVGQTDVPFNPDKVLTNFRMTLAYDLHMPNGMGMVWYNSNNPEGFFCDGVTSPMEEHFRSDPDQWRCVVGPNGWMLHRSLWDEDYARQSKISIHYRDDLNKKSPPEYFPGDLGYYGVESLIKSLEPRKYQYQLDWYWPYRFYRPGGFRTEVVDQIAGIRDRPLEVVVGDRRAVSRGGVATLVEP